MCGKMQLMAHFKLLTRVRQRGLRKTTKTSIWIAVSRLEFEPGICRVQVRHIAAVANLYVD